MSTSQTTPTQPAAPATDPRLLVRQGGLAGYLEEFQRKIKSGDLGSLPVVIGLILIAAIFQSVTGHFLQADNLTNITKWIAGPGLIAVGVVFVLLLGEIDLSLGSVAGVCAAVTSVLAVREGLNEGLAVLLAIGVAVAMGALHGFFFAKIGVPAFVVTLAGMLAWSGLQDYVLGKLGTVNNINDGLVANLDTYFIGDGDILYAWLLALVAIAVFLAGQLLDARRRTEAGLPARSTSEIALRTGALAVLALAGAYTLNQDRGLPLPLVILLGVVVLTDFVLRRTSYGRQIFAVGGGIEAARRAGINVARVRISVFMISAGLAGLGGLFIASQQGSADKTLGGGNVLMSAIAAAVIGGTSLFGGRGKTWSALLGILVIQSITTGLDMVHAAQAIQYMITGAVLLAAVVLDSVSRRTQKSSGRG
ncbi:MULTISPECIES: sugar ABC transporter permease [Streptomycetaceae]|uniref:sugar ABC transporter permease n=1 Tax=Streptomycetaceae TaxID=2062 RepID=UPI000CDC331C|nr:MULTISPECIES: sugar ABC transporter permease [Streptomycetaceae]AUY53388.1 ABC transporter permease [Streptomyces sp. CB01881]MBP0450467.1 sugar ABC transporter permease [Kitasatospora sp. RG8]TYC69539.1 sugar ABC transporter permease [Streptomyces sp. CB01881]